MCQKKIILILLGTKASINGIKGEIDLQYPGTYFIHTTPILGITDHIMN